MEPQERSKELEQIIQELEVQDFGLLPLGEERGGRVVPFYEVVVPLTEQVLLVDEDRVGLDHQSPLPLLLARLPIVNEFPLTKYFGTDYTNFLVVNSFGRSFP